MKKIVLLCANGISTSLLVSKMKKTVKEKGYSYEISAHPVAEAATVTINADVVLLGPQVSYRADAVREELKPIPVGIIDMMHYGMGDALAILESADALIAGN